jgi:RNA polymerase sigma factor (TIGR02999 family)
MENISHILDSMEQGDPAAAAELLPLIYEELRKLAAGHMANEAPGHTLTATGLVHEAFLRLVGPVGEQTFANRKHFFAAASDAMRRILVDSARRKQAAKRGGSPRQVLLDVDQMAAPAIDDDSWIDLHEALIRFESVDAGAAELAKLRIFGGLSVQDAGDLLDIPRATAFRVWTYARAWLTDALSSWPEDS